MKTHIGVAGPHDAIQLVKEVAREFEDRIQLHTFIYSNFDELIQILETHKDVPIFGYLQGSRRIR